MNAYVCVCESAVDGMSTLALEAYKLSSHCVVVCGEWQSYGEG